MMKPLKTTRGLIPMALLAVAGVVALADHHEEAGAPGWFDPAHCDICRPMHDRPDVMQTMKWETHKLTNGMLMTSSVAEDKLKDFYAICESMHSGKPAGDASLCGFCTGFGGLIEAGAMVQEVKTDFGMITLVTSGDPATVQMIHAVADRSLEEMAKMAAAE